MSPRSCCSKCGTPTLGTYHEDQGPYSEQCTVTECTYAGNIGHWSYSCACGHAWSGHDLRDELARLFEKTIAPIEGISGLSDYEDACELARAVLRALPFPKGDRPHYYAREGFCETRRSTGWPILQAARNVWWRVSTQVPLHMLVLSEYAGGSLWWK